MQCVRCQQDNPPPAKYCQHCGAPLALQCANCGAPLAASAKYCGACAHPVVGSGAGRFASPDSYTPKHLVERILISKSALEGERKHVTVLFADLKGSMEFLVDRDPEDARALVDPILELLMDAVHRYEGTVNQVMGDGIMALFGAPLAHEDHTVRACYAALLMQESVRSYASAIGQEALQIRIGLNSGHVVVRSVGSDLRMDYTAVGQTTHLAARMEQLAAPGSILVPAQTRPLLEGFVEVKPLGPMQVKGMTEPVEVYEITGAGAVRTRLQASAARGLTPFVGRAAELEALHGALQQARDGHGQLCAVAGQPGVGKSRLFHEFVQSPTTQDCLVLWSGSVSYGKARPYLPVIDLLKAYFGIEDRDDARKIREKVAGRLVAVDEGLQAARPAFLTLFDVAAEDARWDALDPPQRRHETQNAVRDLLVWEARLQPVVIAIENLHWIDSESQALVDILIDRVPTARVLLIVNYRPEYRHGWGAKRHYRELRLHPLSPDTAEEFLDALVGDDVGLQAAKRLLIERTEGNPFFLEESVRELVETQALIGQRGAYRLAKDVNSFQLLPPTVRAVLAARIDRLSPGNKRLLQCAAVIGKDVPFALLRAVADENDNDIRRGLHELRAADFLYETTLFPEPQYTLKHALTHEVAYDSLLHDRRRALHARIVDALETLYTNAATEQIERLAHHAFRAAMWPKAVTYLREVGVRALGRSANREAAAYLEQALTALQHLPETRERLELGIDVRFDLRNALLPLGQFDRFYGYLREAEGLARKLDDRDRLGWLSVYMCHYLWMTGRSTHARAAGQHAHDIAQSLEDFRLTVAAGFYLALACFAGGDYRRAEQLLRAAIRSLEGDLRQERCRLAGFPAVMSRSYLGLALASLGEVEEGTARAEDGVRLAEAVNHPYSLIVASWALGSIHIIRGRVDDAGGVLERARAVCQEWKQTVLLPLVTGPLGHVYALSGRVPEGLRLLHDALDAMESMGRGAYHSLVVVQLAEASAAADRLDEAFALAERALTLSRERGERGYEALALHLLGEVHAQRDGVDLETARDRYGSALALADELGMRPLVARCHLGLGLLARRAGMPRHAGVHLRQATAMFHTMTMSFWSERADAELRALA